MSKAADCSAETYPASRSIWPAEIYTTAIM